MKENNAKYIEITKTKFYILKYSHFEIKCWIVSGKQTSSLHTCIDTDGTCI